MPEANHGKWGRCLPYFSLYFLDGDMLVDGGVINNYPVDELKARGINYIIGVDVQDDLLKRDDLKSAPDVLMQISNFSTIKSHGKLS